MPAGGGRYRYVVFTLHVTDDTEWKVPDHLPMGLTYITAQLEVATTTGAWHWQGYAEAERPMSLRMWKTAIGSNAVHVEKRMGTASQAIQYCQKEESRMPGPGTSFELGKAALQSTHAHDVHAPFKRALDCDTYSDAVATLREDAARDFVISYKQITGTLRIIFAQPEIYPPKEFMEPPISADILGASAVIFTGPSGIGKTQYAIHHFARPLVISHIDDLKKLCPDHDGIVFDDMIFTHWPPNACIHLCDLELTRAINVKYGTVEIPAGMHRIFTTNRDFRNLFSEAAQEGEWLAIERRCHVVHFDADSRLF